MGSKYRKLLTEFVTKFKKESLIKRVMDIVRNCLATETEPVTLLQEISTFLQQDSMESNFFTFIDGFRDKTLRF